MQWPSNPQKHSMQGLLRLIYIVSLTTYAKFEHLREKCCDGSQVLNPAFFYALENAADANADGTLSCAEFDTAFDADSKIDPESITRCFSSIDSGAHKSAKKSKAAFKKIKQNVR